MTEASGKKLNLARKSLLSAAAFVSVAMPIAFGLFTTATHAQYSANGPVAFQGVSIQANQSGGPIGQGMIMFSPESFNAKGVTLRRLIREAYDVTDDRILDAPDWIDSRQYDIEAKTDSPIAAIDPNERPSTLPFRLPLQTLLAQYFKLRIHPEAKDLSVFALAQVDKGSGLTEVKTGDLRHFLRIQSGQLTTGGGVQMISLVNFLTEQLGERTVIDKTGLK